MASSKSHYVCQSCGVESPKWVGHCPSCNEWNTYVEEIVVQKTKSQPTAGLSQKGSRPIYLKEIESLSKERIQTGIGEFDRVLGGGLVPGSIVLIGGEPGIGKSTLALQFALKSKHSRTLYVSGEESEEQIRMRANRLGMKDSECMVLCETMLENILLHLEELKPDVVIVDSIQTLYRDVIESGPGSIGQVRECTSALLRYAKQSNTPVVLIGHINKEGNIAGPKVLEHIVDAVLQFEGDMHHVFRILRVNKNRFGATSELAIFEMQENGLAEVMNPSELLISQTEEALSGVAIAVTMDGMRPFLIETQALVSSAVYGTPQRSSTGFDARRLNMILAVLEKRAGFRLAAKDVFLNIAGGIRVSDPAIDLAVVVAILSSAADLSVPKDYCFSAEIGLSGEIRPVGRITQRIREAEKTGFKKIFLSRYNKKGINPAEYKIQIQFIGKIDELLKQLF